MLVCNCNLLQTILINRQSTHPVAGGHLLTPACFAFAGRAGWQLRLGPRSNLPTLGIWLVSLVCFGASVQGLVHLAGTLTTLHGSLLHHMQGQQMECKKPQELIKQQLDKQRQSGRCKPFNQICT
jgi:hypothetical protein